MNPADLTVSEVGTRLRDRSLSAIEITRAHLDRIAARDDALQAFVSVDETAAMEAAESTGTELEQGIDRGPLHGIPIAIKDLIDIEGQVTGCGSNAADAERALTDAVVVARLRAAGAIILGKVKTYEYALVGPSFDSREAPARNPWNREHITGGSSSGSASAVAGSLVRIAVGSDTGGSIRSPAGYCGIVGLKGTYEAVPRAGVSPLSQSLDHVGPLAATVAEAALAFDVMAARQAGEGPSPAVAEIGSDVAGLRVAYARDWFAEDPEVLPGVVSAMDDAASALSLLGIRVEEIELPDYELFEAAGAVLIHAEALANHRERLARSSERYGRLAFQTLASGLCLSNADAEAAHAVSARLSALLDREVFRHFDALLTVNTLTTALPFTAFSDEKVVWTPMRTLPFNVTGHPVLAMPCGLVDGLPAGLQLVGAKNAEAMLCRIGHAYEQASDFGALSPPL